MKALIRTFLLAAVLASGVMYGYWRLLSDEKAAAIHELQALNAQLTQSLAQRQAMIDRLSRTRRLAHVVIGHQTHDARGEVMETRGELIELDDDGGELGRQRFAIPGQVLFVDAWTVKFDHERVAHGDPLMGRTLVLLRRIYSDQMQPRDGQTIDTPGAIPAGYAAASASRFEQQLWANFWNVATNADAARRMGVRVAQGEAVYKPVRQGQTFELLVDAAGGISLTPLADAQEALSRAERRD